MHKEIFESAIRDDGEFGAFFEYDGETGYFYLYDMNAEDGRKVVDAIHIFSGEPDFEAEDVSVRWDNSQHRVGLILCSVLWAVFDVSTGARYGGNYGTGAKPRIPPDELFGGWPDGP